MSIKKSVGIMMIILIGITIALILIIPSLSTTYDYKSPSGDSFSFQKSRVGDLTMHVLTTYATYKGQETPFQYTIPLRNDPRTLEDINVQNGINNLILNKKFIYITLDPNYNSDAVLASVEIAKVIGTADYGVFKIPTQGAFIYPSNNTNSTITPIITCRNVNNEIGVISLNLGNSNRIYSSNGCVVLEAIDYDGLIKVADRLVYSLLGVM